MSKKMWVLMVACILIGGAIVDGFTSHLGALVMAIGFSIGSYYDGKKAGVRELLNKMTR